MRITTALSVAASSYKGFTIFRRFRGRLILRMLEQVVKDYAAYFKLDVLNGFQTVQEVVDNMLTRLEELTSVMQMIKLKNSDCALAVSEDINKYRSEIIVLSKKIVTLTNIVTKLHNNIDLIEKQVEKAEVDFGVHNENKIKSLLKPFLKRKDNTPACNNLQFDRIHITSVLDNFQESP